MTHTWGGPVAPLSPAVTARVLMCTKHVCTVGLGPETEIPSEPA